jgi:uncharacterized surface protein with fasciclin (FAS1) repeats
LYFQFIHSLNRQIKTERFMHKRNALIALIMTACLMTMPIAMADSSEDIPTNAVSTGVHDTLVDALEHADLVTTLQGDGPFTVFAPTDAAFTAAGIDLDTFTTDEEIAALADILLYHVYSGAVYAADVQDGMTVAMVNGDDASFTVTDGTVMIEDATVTSADVMASNGVIHVIDKVLMPPADLVDIAAVAMSTGVHDSLVAALVKAELVSTMQGVGPYTVFAPTDQAFTDAGIDLDTFTTDEEIAALTDILLYHVYSGAVYAADVTDGQAVEMVNGDYAQFTLTEGTVMIEDATVTAADVMASNGVIHVIDKVLMPPAPYTGVGICYNTATHMIAAGSTMEECNAYMYVEDFEMGGQMYTGCYNTVSHALTDVTQAICESYMWTPPVDIATTAMSTGIHNTLVNALSASDLVATLQGDGPFTVFAPTDQAFADAGIDMEFIANQGELIYDILLYHVYSGAVNAADVTNGMTVAMVNGDDASFTVTEGTVMVGDATVVLADVPASNGVIHVIDKILMPPADLVDIAAVASSTGVHESLVAALAKADLVSTLQGDGPFTVFAPTDAAFTAAGIDLDTFTTDEEIAALADILLYHVYSGAVNAAGVTNGMTVAMVNGDDASFTVTDGTVMIEDATVTSADVMASNGVIHVIDKVLMPPADEPVIPEGCDYVIGLTDDGMAFDNTDLSIAVGETVCWIWNDAAMAHNVAQIREEGDTTRDVAGEYSGAAATNVDYRITFDEDETFYYICEPHAGMGMDGKVVVGTGISETPTTVVESDDNTPGFTAGIAAIALISALVVAGSRRR